MELCENARHLSCTLRSENWPFHLNSFDFRALLSPERSIHGMRVRPSFVPHSQAGIGRFVSQDFAKGEPVGLYYGNFIYKKMDHDWAGNMYGEVITEVAPRDIQTWTIQLEKAMESSDGQRHKGWSVPTRFNCTKFINDL